MSSALFHFLLMHLPVLILEMSRHVGKKVFLENKVRMYYFTATVGLAAMLQGFKISSPLPGLCVGIRTFQRAGVCSPSRVLWSV